MKRRTFLRLSALSAASVALGVPSFAAEARIPDAVVPAYIDAMLKHRLADGRQWWSQDMERLHHAQKVQMAESLGVEIVSPYEYYDGKRHIIQERRYPIETLVVPVYWKPGELTKPLLENLAKNALDSHDLMLAERVRASKRVLVHRGYRYHMIHRDYANHSLQTVHIYTVLGFIPYGN